MNTQRLKELAGALKSIYRDFTVRENGDVYVFGNYKKIGSVSDTSWAYLMVMLEVVDETMVETENMEKRKGEIDE